MEALSERKSRSRAKRSAAWEQFSVETNGIFFPRLTKIAARCPELTPTQLRVAALTTGLLPSYEIGRILGTTELAVNKIRCRIRKVIGLPRHIALSNYLLALLEEKKKE